MMDLNLVIDIAQTAFIAGIFFRMGGFTEFKTWAKEELEKIDKRLTHLERKKP